MARALMADSRVGLSMAGVAAGPATAPAGGRIDTVAALGIFTDVQADVVGRLLDGAERRSEPARSLLRPVAIGRAHV